MKGWEAIKALDEGKCIFCKSMPAIYYKKKADSIIAVCKKNYNDTYNSVRINGEALLRENWEIYEEPHDFNWAVEQINKGKSVKRIAWVNPAHVNKEGFTNTTHYLCDKYTNFLNINDINANDWVLYSE